MALALWIPLLCMATGTLLVLRSVLLVSTHGDGRFRGDPWVSLFAGFLLLYLGQYLLGR